MKHLPVGCPEAAPQTFSETSTLSLCGALRGTLSQGLLPRKRGDSWTVFTSTTSFKGQLFLLKLFMWGPDRTCYHFKDITRKERRKV